MSVELLRSGPLDKKWKCAKCPRDKRSLLETLASVRRLGFYPFEMLRTEFQPLATVCLTSQILETRSGNEQSGFLFDHSMLLLETLLTLEAIQQRLISR